MAKRKGRRAGPGALRPAGTSKTKRRGRGQLRTQRKIRRNHKDGLFCRLFAEKDNALSLYNGASLAGSQ